jgi:hypothetical protein
VPEPAFGAVSITRNEHRGRPPSYRVARNGSVALSNVTIRGMVAEAFGISANMARFAVVGAPGWLMDARFDITATVPPGTSRAQRRSMLRTLLAERFELRTHTETHENAVYAVRLVRQFEQVQGFVDRPLVDETELTGNFEWVVRLPRVSNANRANAPWLPAFEEQLGLRLQPRTAAWEVRVIDWVRLPAP